MEPFAKHAYMAYLPTVEFGPGITSASEIRAAWPKLDDRRKTAMVMSLYPKTQTNPKLAQTVVKLLDAAIGGEQSVAEGYEPPTSAKGSPAYRASLLRKKQQRQAAADAKKKEQGVAEGAPIVVAQAPIHVRNPKKQQSRQEKPLTAYQQGVASQSKPYKNPYPFDPKAGADVNYDHNQYRAGYKKQGVTEASYMSLDDYKNNLQNALPSIIEYYQDELGFTPSKEQLASAVKAAHATMERTGDTEQAGESLEAVLDSFVPSNSSNKNLPKIDFKKNLLQVLQQKYPTAEFKITPDRVESTDGQLSVIADTEQEGRYVGCFMWDVSTGPYKGALGLAIKQTTDQLLQANPGKKPALFISGDNQNPEAWSYIAKKLKYKLITDENELEENQGWAATYEEVRGAPSGAGAGMTAGYQRRENQPIDEDYIDEKWSKKYKSSINCANPRGFSQRAHCAGRKK
jgi:hypothetical protein